MNSYYLVIVARKEKTNNWTITYHPKIIKQILFELKLLNTKQTEVISGIGEEQNKQWLKRQIKTSFKKFQNLFEQEEEKTKKMQIRIFSKKIK